MSHNLNISSLVGDGTYDRDQVIEIIASVLDQVNDTTADHSDIVKDIKELRTIIEKTRAELSVSSTAGDIQNKHIPTATDELDAVVGATEDATGAIMDACEAIQEHAANMGGDKAQKIEAEVMKIFEACSFQDITGQRITKVVSTLKEIEEKVSSLLSSTKINASDDTSDEDHRSEEEKLLNGPQLAGKGVSQSEVDKLLSDFD